jgi:hypothetical protein
LRRCRRGDTWRQKWERLNRGESNGKLLLRTCPGCSVPEPYRSPDWALVPAQISPRAVNTTTTTTTTTTNNNNNNNNNSNRLTHAVITLSVSYVRYICYVGSGHVCFWWRVEKICITKRPFKNLQNLHGHQTSVNDKSLMFSGKTYFMLND